MTCTRALQELQLVLAMFPADSEDNIHWLECVRLELERGVRWLQRFVNCSLSAIILRQPASCQVWALDLAFILAKDQIMAMQVET